MTTAAGRRLSQEEESKIWLPIFKHWKLHGSAIDKGLLPPPAFTAEYTRERLELLNALPPE